MTPPEEKRPRDNEVESMGGRWQIVQELGGATRAGDVERQKIRNGWLSDDDL